MKKFYLYHAPPFGRRKYIATVKAENDKELRKLVKREHPKLTEWEALRTKYVKDKMTGEISLPPRGTEDKED